MKNFSEIINQSKPTLVDFFAEWCGPCKMMSPILEEVKDELGDSANIIKIDVDKNQEMARDFQIMGVPTLILFKNGEKLWSHSGLLQKQDLVEIIKKHS
ncbi:thioredoxin [Balneicella halophila]|uniref:Thioredoxin n=1 Tax=Balneicella halophila TaxID=1537566 RepID=A0A7L4USD1_BALHA|nr:thioredoxin [Balneicella halophila]PVX52127.1 thioredoxin [Balneicella halophila]